MAEINRLLEIMARLRDPDSGCPWDRAQTYKTIVPHTLEEAYEVADTIEHEDYDSLCDELGDLLFQIVFYAQLAKEESRFNFSDVVTAISDKLVRRHPHVFADAHFENEQAQTKHWEELKQQERDAKASQKDESPSDVPASQLDGIARSLPALSLARKVQARAARVGFDWPDSKGVFDKLQEEISELDDAWHDQQSRAEELGDLLFTCVNLSRHAEVDPEQALRQATSKFERRFRNMESMAAKKSTTLDSLGPEQLDLLWTETKQPE
jgi:ATP diphosphatase